jgi:hypothetical protein
MAEEKKKVVCGLCASHCLYDVRVDNNQFLGPDFQKKPDLSPMDEVVRKTVAGCPRAHAAQELVYHPDRLSFNRSKTNMGLRRWPSPLVSRTALMNTGCVFNPCLARQISSVLAVAPAWF